jgi:hypothetical protein
VDEESAGSLADVWPSLRPAFVNLLAAIPGFAEEREKEIRILEGRGETARAARV